MREHISEILSNEKRFLVIGDVMLDQYCIGKIERISPEAPVPVLKYEKKKKILGGAANVAMNLIGIKQKVSLLSCVGNDANGKEILRLLNGAKIDTQMVALENERITTVKTRFVAGNQQLLRVDDESTHDLSNDTQKKLLELYEKRIDEYDLILLSDYMKGVLSFSFVRKIIDIANMHHKKVIVDVKDKRVEKYAGSYLLKPNRKELTELSGMPVESMSEISCAMKTLRTKAKVQCVLATLSAEGMAFVDATEEMVSEKCDSRKVYDVVGAGDTAFAYIAVAVAYNFPVSKMLRLANTASLVKVTKFGTAVVTLEEVQRELFGGGLKIQSIDSIEQALLKHRGKCIVFTNGCFDILHIGHIKYLKEAKARGDILVVGLNSDASVKRLKGASRPINSQKDRIDMLAEMDFVDYIVLFEEDTPYNLIERVRPNLLVKGGDYQEDTIVGADFVRAIGGKVEVIPFVEGKSTSNVIEKMKTTEDK